MLNFDNAASFELFPRTASKDDKFGEVYPDMYGSFLSAKCPIEGHFIFNEETGQKYLEIAVFDHLSRVVCRGRMFRDPTVQGRPHYTGYINYQEETGPSGSTPRRWQIELSGVVRNGLHVSNSFISGRAFYAGQAAQHSFNDVTKEAGVGF